jgi:pimeloyl-ACP methyl ester carboxylesterase
MEGVVPVLPESRPIRIPDGPGCLFPTGGLTAHWQRPASHSRTGIVVLPIQAGDYQVSTLLADHLARCGHHTLRFERRRDWLEADRDPAELVPHLRQYIRDVSAGIDLWLEHGEVDPQRLGLMGVSMGAIVGTAVLSADPRLKASVLVIGGADLSDILITAEDEAIGEYRNALKARLGLTDDRLATRIREILSPVAEMNPTGKVDPSSILFIASRFDRLIRWPRSTLLWERLGRPRRWILPCGHYSTALFLPLIKWLAKRWFAGRL